MNKDEAREKFGKYSEGPDGEEQWEFDHNKLRGMFLRYSEEVDYLEGTTEWPDAEAWVDNFWSWVKVNVGVGYKGILQCQTPSPSGRFDRLGKGEAVRVANRYYENHDGFKENMDELWEPIDKVEDLPGAGEGYFEELEDMSSKEVLETFFNIYEGHDRTGIGKRQSPNVEGYKYHIKQWVFATDTIQSEETSPSAEALVQEWIDWMAGEILSLEKPIVELEPENCVGGIPIPEEDDIVGWCREVWKDSERFRTEVKEKWNKDVSSDDDALPDATDVKDIRRGIDTSSKAKSGQRGLTDFEI